MMPMTLDLPPGEVFDLAGTGLATTSARVFGVTAEFAHRVNVGEHQRRQQHGPTALRSLELLDVLMDLPAHIPIPQSSLDESVLPVLHAAPAGTVEFNEHTVVRHAAPPTVPVLAAVHTTAARFHDGLVRASTFGAYCRRILLVHGQVDTEALIQADSYGIGVAAGTPSMQTVLLEPEPFIDWQPTPAWWKFSEAVYASYRSSTSA
jgi:hypothetical protein